MSPRRLAPVVIAAVLTVQASPPALAWGKLGHRVAGRYAEARLTPRARAAVVALLEPGESLADASTWADEHKREMRRTASWHYVDVPLDEPRYDARWSGRSASTGRIVDALREQLAILEDASRPIEDRRLALRFVAHLVQDLHQPLHVGDAGDRGGNSTQVRWFARGSNMHKVWDSDVLEQGGGDEASWLAEIEAMPATKADAAGTPEAWATESLRAARDAYRLPGGGRVGPGAKLGADYFEAARPVAARRLQLAGERLAGVLNRTLSDPREPR